MINSTIYDKSLETIAKTEKLYEVLEARGLRVPTTNTKQEEIDPIENLLSFYKEDAKIPVPIAVPITADIPDELQHWLTVDTREWKDSSISPEYLQETVYESLKAKYRPQISVNKETFVPIYDDTFKIVLNQILRRFDDYEEECSLSE